MRLAPAPRRAPDEERTAAARWAILREQNPRLFDGPILNVISADAAAGTITAAPDTYRWHAIGPGLGGAATLLAVTGLVIGRDSAGREHVLCGRRGSSTHLYPGCWEIVPAGGVPPLDPAADLTFTHLVAQAGTELREETDLRADLSAARAIALLADPRAPSLDAVIRIDLTGIDPAAPIRGSWEHDEIVWLPRDRAAGWGEIGISRTGSASTDTALIGTAAGRHVVIPPMAVLLAYIGWR